MNKRKLLSGALTGIIVLGSVLNVHAQEAKLHNESTLQIILNNPMQLNSNIADVITPSGAHEVMEKVNELTTLHPQLSEEQIHSFVVYHLNQKYGKIATKSSGLPYEGRLNPKEKELFNANPVKGTRVLNYAYNAEVRAEARYTPSSLYQGNGDAFRHALWNALMAKDLGTSYAKQWGDAHEYGSSGIDKEMDLYNNDKGRTIVSSIAGGMDSPYWQPRLESELVKNIDNGRLKRIVNNRLVWTNSSDKK